ncbi:MAG: dihydrofolate reductase family protein [Actinomycetota bacterium]|nr:dihydrofolate reductase family protein [Actinomycetota bacterium]
MRKIVAGLFMSLDGVVESPDQWQGPYFNPEMGQVIGGQLAAADTLLLGRKTYQEFAAFWPGAAGTGDPMADQMNNAPKLVVSTTLDTVGWQNSSLVKGDVAEELKRLKQEEGKNLQITGSITLVRSLLRNGLLDELALLVIPVLVGRGQRLFQDADEPMALTLIDSQTLGTGVLSVTYQPTTRP